MWREVASEVRALPVNWWSSSLSWTGQFGHWCNQWCKQKIRCAPMLLQQRAGSPDIRINVDDACLLSVSPSWHNCCKWLCYSLPHSNQNVMRGQAAGLSRQQQLEPSIFKTNTFLSRSLKVKGLVLAIAFLAQVILVTRSTLQSRKWQLIGMSLWYLSALCGHPIYCPRRWTIGPLVCS